MKINTKYFGETEVNEQDLINFPHGLPGFDAEKQFVLLDVEDNAFFKVLQSVKEAAAAFIVANPYTFTDSYEFKLDESTIQTLEIENEENVNVYVILSIKEPFYTSTMNLQAPVILNSKKQIGKQYILNDKKYEIRTPIMQAHTSMKKEG